MLDVYGKINSRRPVSPSATAFLINQFPAYNQRTPEVVTALVNGRICGCLGFRAGACLERRRPIDLLFGQFDFPLPSVDIYARLFASNGVAAGSAEFPVNTNLLHPVPIRQWQKAGHKCPRWA